MYWIGEMVYTGCVFSENSPLRLTIENTLIVQNTVCTCYLFSLTCWNLFEIICEIFPWYLSTDVQFLSDIGSVYISYTCMCIKACYKLRHSNIIIVLFSGYEMEFVFLLLISHATKKPFVMLHFEIQKVLFFRSTVPYVRSAI